MALQRTHIKNIFRINQSVSAANKFMWNFCKQAGIRLYLLLLHIYLKYLYLYIPIIHAFYCSKLSHDKPKQNADILQINFIIAFLTAVFMYRTFWELLIMSYNVNGVYEPPTFNNFPNHLVMRFYSWYNQNSTMPTEFTIVELTGGIILKLVSLYAIVFDNFMDLWCLTAAVLLKIIMDGITSKLKDGTIKFDQECQVYNWKSELA